jgi:hypothetical protein
MPVSHLVLLFVELLCALDIAPEAGRGARIKILKELSYWDLSAC